jgi:hypothetical protein
MMKWHLNLLKKDVSSRSISLIIILSWFVWAVFYSLNIAINVPTTHLDGAFQTASGLFRLDDGQFPGRDFFPYLGIGPLYLMYPIYKLFGSNLASSVVAGYLVVATAVMISTSFVTHMIWKPKSPLISMAVGCVFFYVADMVSDIPHYDLLAWGFKPGNSLRPLRSFVPYLAAVFLYWSLSRIKTAQLKYTVAGALTAVVLLWSNDFAFSTAFLLGVFLLIYSLLRDEFTIKNTIGYLGAVLIIWCGLFYLACHGHPVEMLKYNFADAAPDQWWYFGPYTEQSRVFSFKQFLKMLFKIQLFGLLVFASLSFHAIKYKSIESILLLWVGLALYAGGIVASVGGHVDSGYFAACKYWIRVTFIFGSLRLMWLNIRPKYDQLIINNRRVLQSSIYSVLGLILFTPVALTSYQYRQNLINAKADKNRFFVAELGGYLSKDWGDYVQLARSTSNKLSVVEEYWGVWSALRHSFFNWPVDAIIHALGNTRNTAKLNMQNADIVISTRRTNFEAKIWQPWNLSQNYWFYESLLSKYSISFVSPNTIVWRQTGIATPMKNFPCEPVHIAGNTALKVTIPSSGYYEVDMKYKANGNSRSLVMVQNHINFGSDSDGYISINPKTNQAKFPAYFKATEHALLNIKVVGNKDTSIEVSTCTAKQITFSNEEMLPLQPSVPMKEPDK